MLGCQCLPLLNRAMVWVMSSLCYGSNAAFHVTVHILLRYVSHNCGAFYELFLSICKLVFTKHSSSIYLFLSSLFSI